MATPAFSPPVAACIAAGLCLAILLVLLRTGLAWRIAVDVPNHRSLHERPVPRIGGWGVVPPALLFVVVYAPSLWGLGAGTVILAVVSQIDDRRGLSARVRFAVHLVVASTAVAFSATFIAWWLAILFVIAIVWLVNLYNFMDGANGLAGGMAVFGFATYAIAAGGAQPELSLVAASVAGAAFGFLILNFRPAKVFLGDAGSIPLGFFAGALGFWGWQHDTWPVWFPVMVFSPFIADATVTLVRRLARGEKFWQAHREHYYQRLVQSGYTHVRVALFYYLLMLAGSSIALTARDFPTLEQWGAVFCWYVVLGVVGCAIDHRWRAFVDAQSAMNER